MASVPPPGFDQAPTPRSPIQEAYSRPADDARPARRRFLRRGRKMATQASQPHTWPAGWYDVQDRANTRGYWDGEKWTGDYAPANQGAMNPPTTTTASRDIIKIALGVVLGFTVSVVGCAALVGAGAHQAAKDIETKGGNSSQTFSPSVGGRADNSPSADGPTFENEVLTTPDLKIQITRYKVIGAGQKGNEYGKKPVIAFWYKTTNLSGAKVDPTDWLFHFKAYQDNNPNAENELDVGMLSDDRFLDSQTENIKKGGTVENAVSYELDGLDTPVDLVATEGLGTEVIGKATYKLR